MNYREFGKTGEKISALGFGCMRLPGKLGRIDMQAAEQQIMAAIENGVNYFRNTSRTKRISWIRKRPTK